MNTTPYKTLVGVPTANEQESKCWLLQFDGGSSPNPGPSAAGAILWTPEIRGVRRVAVEEGVAFPHATNNESEYEGLLTGLRLALEYGVCHLCIEGDSTLVVKQILDEWKVKESRLLVKYQKAKRALKEFDTVQIRWVPRSHNTYADKITKDIHVYHQSFRRETMRPL